MYSSVHFCIHHIFFYFFFFQAEDGIRDLTVTGVQTCALPIWTRSCVSAAASAQSSATRPTSANIRSRCASSRSEEHTSELQSQSNLVCRLLLEKKKNTKNYLSISKQHERHTTSSTTTNHQPRV